MNSTHQSASRSSRREGRGHSRQKEQSTSKRDSIPHGLLANPRTVVEATYRKPELEKWAGYPSIEALPKLIARENLFEVLQACPPYRESFRKKRREVRSHLVMDILHFFQPLSIHARLDGMVSRAMYDGYIGRNPLDPRNADSMNERLAYFRNNPYTLGHDRNTASAFLVCGMSGLGKSTGVTRVLGRYPQAIVHKKYRNSRYTKVQIVYVYLECPKDGSTKGLCIDFFKTLDFIMGGQTHYSDEFGKESRATNQLMESMANMAMRLQIGMIVIDEIQYLNVAKSGGEEEFLNFMVRLINIIGVPVVFLGTPDAEQLFSKALRQTRRCSGQGDLFLEPFKLDGEEEENEWEIYAESLWKHQFVSTPSPLTKELSNALHDVSFGIPDLANKVYLTAQVKAMETKDEVITEGMLRSAYRDDCRLLSHAVEILKSGRPDLLQKLKDVHMRPALPVEATNVGN